MIRKPKSASPVAHRGYRRSRKPRVGAQAGDQTGHHGSQGPKAECQPDEAVVDGELQ